MSDWPKVLERDDGMRPHVPGACFYCHQKVGEPHGRECVTVSKRVRFGVYLSDKRDGVEVKVGTFEEDIPFFWDQHTAEFARNEGSWCANNALDEIKWTEERWEIEAEDFSENNGCCCSLLEFRLEEVLNPGPLQDPPHTNEAWDRMVESVKQWNKETKP